MWKELKTDVPIDLKATLFCGQIFHFDVLSSGLYTGNVHGYPAILIQLKDKVYFFEICSEIEKALSDFFNLNVEVPDILSKTGLRFITNDFESAVYSFICSANNNIKRITKMVKFIYSLGEKIDLMEIYRDYLRGSSTVEKIDSDIQSLSAQLPDIIQSLSAQLPDIAKDLDGFDIRLLPSAATIADCEIKFRRAGFGYRAEYVASAGAYLQKFSRDWTSLTYEEARNGLLEIKGVGRKVADCICLTSLKFFHVVPLDVHIIRHSVIEFNLGYKKVNTKQYDEIQKLWVEKYGKLAGIWQLHVFKMIQDNRAS